MKLSIGTILAAIFVGLTAWKTSLLAGQSATIIVLSVAIAVLGMVVGQQRVENRRLRRGDECDLTAAYMAGLANRANQPEASIDAMMDPTPIKPRGKL